MDGKRCSNHLSHTCTSGRQSAAVYQLYWSPLGPSDRDSHTPALYPTYRNVVNITSYLNEHQGL